MPARRVHELNIMRSTAALVAYNGGVVPTAATASEELPGGVQFGLHRSLSSCFTMLFHRGRCAAPRAGRGSIYVVVCATGRFPLLVLQKKKIDGLFVSSVLWVLRASSPPPPSAQSSPRPPSHRSATDATDSGLSSRRLSALVRAVSKKIVHDLRVSLDQGERVIACVHAVLARAFLFGVPAPSSQISGIDRSHDEPSAEVRTAAVMQQATVSLQGGR